MLHNTLDLLRAGQRRGFAVGAFNVYNLEGVRAVVAAAEASRSPAILQVHPAALAQSGRALLALCLAAAQDAAAPVSVHLDHATSEEEIRLALEQGLSSVMFDGSALRLEENLRRTRDMAQLAHDRGAALEAELGRLSGSEDELSIPEYEEKLTDPAQAAQFVESTGTDALAVCIGNVHGRYAREPRLDFARLEKIQKAIPVPLVLHGASGLGAPLLKRSIELGVRKFNVNTEVRAAYVEALKTALSRANAKPDLVQLMGNAVTAMQAVVSAKLRAFGSAGMAAECSVKQ